ncbi:hypothetical protein FOA43_003794 [Brettanomyces nanus]|uniref:UBA domain-containing protein n=1 Tax=Eeniella nana TaxID=13502 RepID=A0A875S840_EENNA|nr:uncharacterized protein FOA43_003794 [Brettanomyces nanus]QPG76405.1 hypothetical protein FOA43_003794 [Brettanomyces nanus]
MAQRMNMSSFSDIKSSQTKNYVNLDFLDEHLPGSQTNLNASNGNPSSSDASYILSSFTEPVSRSETPPPQHERSKHAPMNYSQTSFHSETLPAVNPTADLLEGFFSPSVSRPLDVTTVEPLTRSHGHKPSIETSYILSSTDSPADLRDGALAELIDMGFPIEGANMALDSTGSGHDIDGAISFLMSEAHDESKVATHSSHIHKHKNHMDKEEDFGTVMNDLSNEFISRASILFRSGKKKIREGIELYKHQQYEKADNQPAWMKNQATYKAQSQSVAGGDDEQELLPEDIRNITEHQRERDRAFRRDREYTFDNKTEKRKKQAPVLPPHRKSKVKVPSREQSELHDVTAAAAPALDEKNNQSLVDITGNSLPPVSSTLVDSSALSYSVESAYTTEKSRAAESFKVGDFPKALSFYQSALDALPEGHALRIIMLSNISTVYEKLGNAKDQLAFSVKGLDQIASICPDFSGMTDIKIEKDKSLSLFWIKLLSRKAEALEHLEKFRDSLDSYNQLLSHGVSNKSIMDGRKRCMDVLHPRPRKKAMPKSARVNSKMPDTYDTMKRVQEKERLEEREENERFILHDEVEGILEHWIHGNENNIRALLAGLHEVLWPELNWKPVSMSDLVLDKKVKIVYMKAVSRVHPDKIGREVNTERKMIANNVFITLNEAWEKYKEANNIQ